ncbi:SHOCT domain-containing protein [Streptomyces sp. NPDC086549]|uniref:SHOCT domain-containing protein n=1 Tax=Streptomyces sp. NPDC086549 TaxID=3365752 RepID=UPI0037F21762
MILFWGLLIAAGVLLFRAVNRGPGQRPSVPRPEPEQLLAERFARGEIDEDEYRRKLAVLKAEGRDGAGYSP